MGASTVGLAGARHAVAIVRQLTQLQFHGQAVTGTRYPTLPGFNFYYPYPTRNFFQNFRVQGSNYTCYFQYNIMPERAILLQNIKIESVLS